MKRISRYNVKHDQKPDDVYSKIDDYDGDEILKEEVWRKNGKRISGIKFGRYVSPYAVQQINLLYTKRRSLNDIIAKANEEVDEPARGALFFILENGKLFFRISEKGEETIEYP